MASLVAAMPKARRFDCREAVQLVEPVLGFEPSMKSMARALSYLVLRGDVRVAEKVKRPGENFAINRYGRGERRVQAAAQTLLLPEPEGTVTREALTNGNTRVSFGLAWKPYREPKTERPWRGYESGLSRI